VRSIRLPFNLMGIPVRLDLSFLLVLPLFAWLISAQLPAYIALLQRAGFTIEAAPLLEGITPYLLGLFAALGLFTGVLLHELGHALAARIYGIQAREIILWFLGGLARFDDLPRKRGAEAVIGIAGPLTSFLLGGIAGLLWYTLPVGGAWLFLLSYLTLTNLLLGAFNLLPALPLDGGRILRSLLALFMPHLRATRISAQISRLIAILLGLYGFFTFQLFLVIIAFFVFNAVTAESRYAQLSSALEGRTAADLMTREIVAVTPDTTVDQLLHIAQYQPHRSYPVLDSDSTVLGLVPLALARGSDPQVTVGELMGPAETINGRAGALDTLQRMGGSDLGRLLVVDREGRLIGIIGQREIIQELHQVGLGVAPQRPEA